MWYHYFDAQEVFNSIRCYIAAYVWMTGFGKRIFLFFDYLISELFTIFLIGIDLYFLFDLR